MRRLSKTNFVFVLAQQIAKQKHSIHSKMTLWKRETVVSFKNNTMRRAGEQKSYYAPPV